MWYAERLCWLHKYICWCVKINDCCITEPSSGKRFVCLHWHSILQSNGICLAVTSCTALCALHWLIHIQNIPPLNPPPLCVLSWPTLYVSNTAPYRRHNQRYVNTLPFGYKRKFSWSYILLSWMPQTRGETNSAQYIIQVTWVRLQLHKCLIKDNFLFGLGLVGSHPRPGQLNVKAPVF